MSAYHRRVSGMAPRDRSPTLSVVTPSYNQGEFIERTIRSVLDQGYENLEYMIVDGGSTDQSVEVIRRYEDRLAWWVSEPDEGQADAINKGIRRSTGEIVAYINSDDHYLPGAFETAIRALEASDVGWVAGTALDRDADDNPVGDGYWRAALPASTERAIRGRQWWMLAPWSAPQPSVFWRREVFERFGLFRPDMHYAFDAEFMLRLAYADEMPLILDAELSTRVTHSEQKSSDMDLWKPELRELINVCKPKLTLGERARLAIVRVLRAAGFYRFRALPVRVLAGIPLNWAGDMLEHVPERWRPRIRHRDRDRGSGA